MRNCNHVKVDKTNYLTKSSGSDWLTLLMGRQKELCNCFKFKVKINYETEQFISTKNDKLETFYKKWSKDQSPC